MKKVFGLFVGFKSFFSQVKDELVKCSWPTRPELIESTVVVIVSVLILGVYVSVCDTVAVKVLNLVIR